MGTHSATGLRIEVGALVLIAMFLGCAEGGTTVHDGASSDVAPPPTSAGSARELVSGGARLAGGTIVMEAALGHAFSQERMSGGTFQIEAATVVKP